MWTQERPQKGELSLKSARTDENVAALTTKHLTSTRVEELLSKFGVRRCTTGLVVASLFTRVGADHFGRRTDRVATTSLALEVVLLVVVCKRIGCSHWLCWQLVVLEAAGGFCSLALALA